MNHQVSESQVEHLNHDLIQSFRQVGHPDVDTKRGQSGSYLIYGNLSRGNNSF